jgi:hypothetical protein
MKTQNEQGGMSMNEGDFGSNFMWYEWGFVSPEQLPTNEAQMADADVLGYGRHSAPYEARDDDNRWAT